MFGELVSVIIPAFNRAHTIKRAIDSVRGQSYKNIEVIVVDDCSTDGTIECVQKWYGDADWLLYVINDENVGAAASRNIGVQYAHGDYIAFQDSDDEWMPDKLECQMRLMDKSPDDVGMIYCCMERRMGEEVYDVWPPAEAPMEVKSGNMLKTLLLGPVISTQTMLIDKQAFLDCGGFDVGLKVMEDYEFSVRFARTYRIGLVDKTLVIQHESAGGINSNLTERIITQSYVMEQGYEDMRRLGIVTEKMSRVYEEAENYGMVKEYLSCLLSSKHMEYHAFAKKKLNLLKES